MNQTLIKTTDLCDDFSDQLQICDISFRSFGAIPTFHGPIHTVDVLNDNVLVKQALETIPADSVLVVDGRASNRCALLGDRLAAIAAKRNLAGIIINGRVRDARDLQTLEVGIFALGTHPKKSIKQGKGTTDGILQFGGINWIPGHYLYADEDGVVLSEKPLHK